MKKVPNKPAIPTRRSRRKETTRAKIIHSALELLSRQEYSSTTVEQITEAADVGKGTYFNYFESKEHLLHEVGKEQVEIISLAVEIALKENKNVKQVLKDLFFTLTETYRDNSILARNLIIANLSNDSARNLMSANIGERARWLAKLIQRGQENGNVRTDLKPLIVAHWFLHLYFGNLMYLALQPPTRLEGWAEFSFEQFWRSIASGSSNDSKGVQSKRKRGMNAG